MLHSKRQHTQVLVPGSRVIYQLKTHTHTKFKSMAVTLGNWRNLEESVSRSVTLKKALGEKEREEEAGQ